MARNSKKRTIRKEENTSLMTQRIKKNARELRPFEITVKPQWEKAQRRIDLEIQTGQVFY